MNPRASRTVPFVSKATGMPLAKIAARCMVGQTLAAQGATQGNRAGLLLGQGSDLPVRQVPGRRPDPRPGDALHRRGDGRRPQLRRGVGARAGSRRHQGAAGDRQGLRLGARSRQAARAAGGAGPDRARLHAGRHRTAPPTFLRGQGVACERDQQGHRGPAAHRRPDQERRDRLHRQHHRRHARRSPTRSRSVARRCSIA